MPLPDSTVARDQLPAAPERSFASDNSAGAHPSVIEAIARANRGHALAYGADAETERCQAAFDDLFGRPMHAHLTFNGTGSNVLALTVLARPGDAVICAAGAHIDADEGGAPERIAGVKLIDVPTEDGKLRPDDIDAHAQTLGVEHHAQPTIVSITQSTELGTVYSVDEIGAVCDAAHRHGMRVHLDGARIANAVAALGGTPEVLREMTAPVDVISFGGTKNGAICAEAVLIRDPAVAARARFIRKTITQLASKMRFQAVQFSALFADGLWLDLATHANAMAQRLYAATVDMEGVGHRSAPAVNGLFPTLPRPAIAPLQAWSPFYEWDPARDQVRWMASWDTTSDDIDRFAAALPHFLRLAID